MTAVDTLATRPDAPPVPGILGLPGRLPFSVQRFLPADDLRWCVELFWVSSWDVAPGQTAVTRVLPHPNVNLTLEQGQLCVTGVADGVFTRRLTGSESVFGVKLRPAVFRLLSDVSVGSLSGAGQSAHGVLPGSAGLELSLNQATENEQRADLVEQHLRQLRLLPTHTLELVNHAVTALSSDPDVHLVQDVALRLGVSSRTLQRLFRAYVGVTPGWVLRRGRLHAAAQRVLQLTAAGDTVRWADVAAEFGYADQAHFTRDFSSVLGVPPTNWVASLCDLRPV